MKNYIKMFEDFSNEAMGQVTKICCDPLKLLIAFENQGGDSLRWAAFTVSDAGFEVAEKIAEDAEEVMAVRALKSCASSKGVDAIAMLDLLEDMRMNLDEVNEMLHRLREEGEAAVLSMRGGRAFLNRLNSIMC